MYFENINLKTTAASSIDQIRLEYMRTMSQ